MLQIHVLALSLYFVAGAATRYLARRLGPEHWMRQRVRELLRMDPEALGGDNARGAPPLTIIVDWPVSVISASLQNLEDAGRRLIRHSAGLPSGNHTGTGRHDDLPLDERYDEELGLLAQEVGWGSDGGEV